jgi:hypothetical protein
MFETTPLTVGALREAIATLADDHPILIEDGAFRYDIVKAFAIGTATNDPGLVLHIRTASHR